MDVSVSRAGVDFAGELTMKDFDAAIVGAGPAGSATAIALAQRGYAVVLVDKQQFPREKLCGDFVNPINWPIFRELGVEERVLNQPHAKVTGFRLTSCSGAEAESPFSTENQRMVGLGIRRAQLDQLLLERAGEAGATIRTDCRIERLLRSGQEWRFETSTHETWRARLLVGADGRNSWIAHRLGMNSKAVMHGRSIGFQAHLTCPGAAYNKVEIHLFPGGYAGLIGLGDGTINLCLSVDKRKLLRDRIEKFLLGQCLPQNPSLNAILRRSERVSRFRSAYPIYSAPRRCFTDGALLVGDAARVSEPATGEGVYFAMQSGILAAEMIHEALACDDLSAKCLRGYEQKCKKLFRRRYALNSLIRFAIYRPALINPLIRLFAKHGHTLVSLVDMVCAPPALRQ
jgi:menaquinone-9 beta-reductase